MADKPSRALVLYGDGLARFADPTHTHLNSFASRAACGFLALPITPHSEDEEEARAISEFAELLDANEAYSNLDAKEVFGDKPQEKSGFPSLAERFMGMKAALITKNSRLKSFGDKLGFKVLQWDGFFDSSHPASELLSLLGFHDGKTLDTNLFDIVFVHVGANEKIDDLKILNLLVGELLHNSKSDIGSRLHVSLVLSYGGTTSEDDRSSFLLPDVVPKNNGELTHIIPRQNYMIKGGKPRENIRKYCPMLLAQYQNAVTRKDMVKTFTYEDIFENGGNLVIPADRFLHEVAFKLWKAPKYGA